jgi:thioredoxin-related protein
MKQLLIFLSFLAVCSATGRAQTPPSADQVLQAAYAKAAKEDKKVFLIFHASWCGWCRKMDSSMNDVSCKKFLDDNFVITHLVVMESKGKENLENPGALDLLKKYKADRSGIPFWVVFDAEGNMLADAKMPPQNSNTGCPAKEEEVEYFIDVLKKVTNPGEAELNAIRTRFRKNEYKRPASVPAS